MDKVSSGSELIIKQGIFRQGISKQGKQQFNLLQRVNWSEFWRCQSERTKEIKKLRNEIIN